MSDPPEGRPLRGKPDNISPELWERLSAAYYSNGIVSAHMDMWRLGRWSFEHMLVRLVLEQAKGAAATGRPLQLKETDEPATDSGDR